MKKMFGYLGASILTIGLLVSCGGSEKPEDEKKDTVEKNDNTEKKDDTVVDTDEVKEVTIDVMMSFPRFQEDMETYIAKFKEKELEEKGIDVTVNLEMPASDQYATILQTRLTSSNAPDLYTISAASDLKTYYEAGQIADLSAEPFTNKLYEGVKDTVSIDGNVYLLPFESNAWGYLYNKEVFEKSGIDKKPETFDELVDAVGKMEAAGFTPFQLSYQDSWVPQLMTALTLGGLVSGEKTDWLDKMYNDEGSYSEVAEIFDVIDLVMEHGTKRGMDVGFEAACANFAMGEVGIYINGTWSADAILNNNPDFQLGVGALPINNNANNTMVNLATTTSLALHPESDNKEVALDFMNFILDENESSSLYGAMKFNPVADVHDYEVFPWTEEAYEYVADGKAYLDLVLPNAVTDEQAKQLQLYYIGDVTSEEIIETLDKTFKEANAVSN